MSLHSLPVSRPHLSVWLHRASHVACGAAGIPDRALGNPVLKSGELFASALISALQQEGSCPVPWQHPGTQMSPRGRICLYLLAQTWFLSSMCWAAVPHPSTVAKPFLLACPHNLTASRGLNSLPVFPLAGGHDGSLPADHLLHC